MGRLFLVKLNGRIYSCRVCHSHLANVREILSKTFHCRHGRAYLFNSVYISSFLGNCTFLIELLGDLVESNTFTVIIVNVTAGVLEERIMTTGMHTVADIYCNGCHKLVGWKYEFAHEKNQKYKEGKFILERAKLISGDGTDVAMDPNSGSTSESDEQLP